MSPGCSDMACKKRGGGGFWRLAVPVVGAGGDSLTELLMPRLPPFLSQEKPVERGPLAPFWRDLELARAVPDTGGDPHVEEALGSPHLGARLVQ